MVFKKSTELTIGEIVLVMSIYLSFLLFDYTITQGYMLAGFVMCISVANYIILKSLSQISPNNKLLY
jgi:hypothetical protein